jgi:UPF0042 nucleotide-binding protein
MSDLNEFHVVIITGMSGAGKTTAVQSLEDLGFFCVDNLPPVLIPKFAELIEQSDGKIKKAALVIDLRSGEFFQALFHALERLDRMANITYQIVFLDANDDVLIRRYKETRRKHPLSEEGSPLEGIYAERKLLEELKGKAHIILDTSHLKPKQLKEKIAEQFTRFGTGMVLNIQSFGFKYGIPIDADLVFDVRFLPNPHYVETLKPLTGLHQDVADYVFKWPETEKFMEKLYDFLDYTLPHYQQEGKGQLVIAIGCTGGKHRSVAIAEALSQKLGSRYAVRTTHRDVEKDR